MKERRISARIRDPSVCVDCRNSNCGVVEVPARGEASRVAARARRDVSLSALASSASRRGRVSVTRYGLWWGRRVSARFRDPFRVVSFGSSSRWVRAAPAPCMCLRRHVVVCGEPRGVFTCAHLERVRSRECAACVDWSAVPKTSVVGTCGFTYKHVIEC